MNTQGIERIPDSLGYFVLNEDGAVLSSGGELENKEKLAEKLMIMTRLALKQSTEKDLVTFRRLTVTYEDFFYAITISNHKVFISKRRYAQQEPVVT